MPVTEDGFVSIPPRPIAGRSGLPMVGSGLEGLGPALAELGGAIGRIVDPDRGLRQAVIQRAFLDPEFAAELGRAQRQAEAGMVPEIAGVTQTPAGPVPILGVNPPNVLGELGIPLEVTRSLASLSPASPEELTEPQETKARAAGFEAEAERGTFLEMLFGTGNFLGTPVVQAGAEFQTAQNELVAQQQIAEKELPMLRAAAEGSALRLGIQETEFFRQLQTGMEQIFPQLDKKNRNRLIISMRSPQFMQDIQFRESLSMQELLARMRVSAAKDVANLDTLADILALGSKANKDIVEMNELLFDPDTSDEALVDLRRRYNTAVNLAKIINSGLGSLGLPDVFGENAELGEARGVRGFLDIGAPGGTVVNPFDRVGTVAGMLQGTDPEQAKAILDQTELSPGEKTKVLEQLGTLDRLGKLSLFERFNLLISEGFSLPGMSFPGLAKGQSNGN